MTAKIQGYAVLAIARLHTLGYEARPSAWMQDVGCELDTETAAAVLAEHYYDRRYAWLPSLCAWLITDERYGCIGMASDDDTKTALRALAERVRDGGHGSAMLNAAAPLLRKFDSATGAEAQALRAACVFAKTAMELVREARIASCEDLKLLFSNAVRTLATAHALHQADAAAFLDEFNQAIADNIERLLYPHRAGLTRRPGNCQTARMLREQQTRSDN